MTNNVRIAIFTIRTLLLVFQNILTSNRRDRLIASESQRSVSIRVYHDSCTRPLSCHNNLVRFRKTLRSELKIMLFYECTHVTSITYVTLCTSRNIEGLEWKSCSRFTRLSLPDLHHIWSFFYFILILLTSSFAVVINSAATRGHRLTRNINTGRNKLI